MSGSISLKCKLGKTVACCIEGACKGSTISLSNFDSVFGQFVFAMKDFHIMYQKRMPVFKCQGVFPRSVKLEKPWLAVWKELDICQRQRQLAEIYNFLHRRSKLLIQKSD